MNRILLSLMLIGMLSVIENQVRREQKEEKKDDRMIHDGVVCKKVKELKSKLKVIDEAKKEFLKENNRVRKEAKKNLKKAKKERKACGEEEKKTDKKVLL